MPNRTLNADDRRAVDLLLDLGADNAHTVTRTAMAGCQRRLGAVERLLAKLDALPPADPPAGLAARTVTRVMATAPGEARSATHFPSVHLH